MFVSLMQELFFDDDDFGNKFDICFKVVEEIVKGGQNREEVLQTYFVDNSDRHIFNQILFYFVPKSTKMVSKHIFFLKYSSKHYYLILFKVEHLMDSNSEVYEAIISSLMSLFFYATESEAHLSHIDEILVDSLLHTNAFTAYVSFEIWTILAKYA